MQDRRSLLWPIPQEAAFRDDALPLADAVLAAAPGAGETELAPLRLFADMIMDDHNLVVPIVRGRVPAGKIPIRIGTADKLAPPEGPLPTQPEGYLLKVSAQGAEAVGRDTRGAQHAVATLVQLAERRGDQVVLRGAEIRDWPYKPVRMVHLYLPGADHLNYARRYLRDFLVRYKFNGLFIEVGGGVRLRGKPELAAGWRRFVEEMRAIGDTGRIYGEHCPLGPGRRFSGSIHTHLADGRYVEAEDLAALFDWAREYHLEPVPEIQSLSHAYYLATVFREIAEIQEADFPDSYCPSNPRSYEILFQVMQEYIELAKCRSVHIGHDEWRQAGWCEKCRQRDTGELFGEDVVKIASWLIERGLGVWMWSDHLVPTHNGIGRKIETDKVVYDHPDTQRAAEIIRAGAPHITILNWSWYRGQKDADEVIADLGFKQIYGNFDGRRFPDWEARSAHPSVLGAEISSWCAWEDFELGMIHYPPAMYSANLLWSNRWPEPRAAEEMSARQMPRLRDRLKRSWGEPRLWSLAVKPERKRVVSIAPAANAPLKTDQWDLSGLRVGPAEYDGVPYSFGGAGEASGSAVVVVERAHKSEAEYPHVSASIPIEGEYGALIFWQAADAKGGEPAHAGDGTNFPRDAAELLGWYEVRYADGLSRSVEIRYGENVMEWDHGHALLYQPRELPAGELPDGRPLVVWGLEWTNPRPGTPIVSITLHGAGALPPEHRTHGGSDARPMLLGITTVETPKWEDYRPEKKGKLPGWE